MLVGRPRLLQRMTRIEMREGFHVLIANGNVIEARLRIGLGSNLALGHLVAGLGRGQFD